MPPPGPSLRWRDAALLTLVALIWGFNFVVIRWGLGAMPPLVFSALRFVCCAVPWVFICRRPAIGWRGIGTLGLVLGVGVFGFLFAGIAAGAPPGLASLLMQSQVFFTALLASLVLGEALRPYKVVAMALGMAGMAIVAAQQAASGNAWAFGLILCGALCWGWANVLLRRTAGVNMLGLMVWISLVPPVPLLALAALQTSPGAVAAAIAHMGWRGSAAVLYTAILSTIVGYGVWGGMLQRYETTTVAQFALLVPVFGLMSAGLVYGEHYGPAQGIAVGLILLSLALANYGHVIHQWVSREART